MFCGFLTWFCLNGFLNFGPYFSGPFGVYFFLGLLRKSYSFGIINAFEASQNGSSKTLGILGSESLLAVANSFPSKTVGGWWLVKFVVMPSLAIAVQNWTPPGLCWGLKEINPTKPPLLRRSL